MGFEDVYANVSSTSYVAGYYDEVNDEYADVLQDLLPTGQAWNYADGSEEHSLLRTLGYPLKRIVLRGLDLLREFHPDTMFELLSDWERVLGLPGDNPSPPSTVASRRLAVHARLLGYGDPNIEFFETMASELGYTDAYVNQHFLSSFVPGSVAGDPCASKWQYVWEMVTPRGDDDTLLQWSLENVVPEHTKLVMFWLLNPELQSFDSAGGTVFQDVVYNGSDLWCAVGATGSIQTSPDGVTWTKQTAGGGYTGTFYRVAYNGSNLWCAVGTSGGIQTSPDGVTWTQRTAAGAYSGAFHGIHHDQSGLWVAVGYSGEIQTSPDGITWTARTAAAGYTGHWFSAVYGNGIWIICGQDTTYPPGYGRIQTSPDGITWTDRPPVGSALGFRDVEFDGSTQFLVVGVDSQLQTSSNGIDWRRRESPSSASDDFIAVVYASNRWIVLGYQNGDLVESWYGEDWKRQVLTKTDFYGMGYGDGICCLVGGTAGDQVYTAEV